MRDPKCKICGKDTGQGRKGNTRVKHRGGFRHLECTPIYKNPNYWKEYAIRNKEKLQIWKKKYYIENLDYYQMYHLVRKFTK